MHTRGQGEDDAHFELEFSPNVTLIGTVRRFVGEFYSTVLADLSIADMLVVATHELLENAVRYSSDGNTWIRLGLRKSGSEMRVTISTRNRATPANLEVAKRTLDELIAAPDAMLHYQTLMRRSAKRKEGSGLGLGRVRAETEMVLSYRLDGSDLLLEAVGTYDLGSA